MCYGTNTEEEVLSHLNKKRLGGPRNSKNIYIYLFVSTIIRVEIEFHLVGRSSEGGEDES